MGSTERRLGVYLRSFPQAVTLLFHGLIHGSFMILSPQTGFRPPIFSCFAAVRFSAVKGNNFCSNTYNFLDFSPCCSTTILPIVVIESLNTSVRVCFAQPSHSGAECDPRHRGAVFTWESNHPKAPPLIGPSLAVTDTPTESTDTLAAGPKNGYFRIHQISETEELKLASLSILDG